MDTNVYGADSETLEGRPMSFQFYGDRINKIIFVNEGNAIEKFFDVLDRLPKKQSHIFFVHNLGFDLVEFFWQANHLLVANPGGAFDFDYGDWRVTGVYGAPTFARISSHNTQILFVDSMLWFKGTLEAAAELFCPDLPKLKRPKDLGSKQFTSKDSTFCAYAMRDAEVAYHIGLAVLEMHKQFDIPQAVSLADMAAKIFRRHFLTYTIPQPDRAVIEGALYSYHGGKNNVIPGAAPHFHTDISAFDISSAYPFAMSELPAFSNGKLYKRYALRRTRLPSELPPWGVYQVSGTAAQCDWPSLFSHTFDPLAGKVSNVWVQGLELNEALRSGEFRPSQIRGYYYDAERDHGVPALRAFVDHFYRLKQTEKNPVQRHMYKIILNSLYGKFIQTRKGSKVLYTDIDTMTVEESTELVAGGMFHPFIATAITAHTRAYIHKLEHRYNAIHTATDGIFTRHSRTVRMPGYPSQGLGSLTVEARGDLLLLRNKLYVLYSGDGSRPSQGFKGKRIAKFALHGFQGTVGTLERLVARNQRKYKSTRPNRLRESLKRGLVPNKFEERDYVLKVGPITSD